MAQFPDYTGAMFYRYWTYNSPPYIGLDELRVIRQTPAGVWLDNYGTEKFVLLGEGKRYAYPTKELARESYLIRCRWRLTHLRNQMNRTELGQQSAQARRWPDEEAGRQFLRQASGELWDFQETELRLMAHKGPHRGY